jgi:multicomponent Na+:H+ antiporter subunit E
MRKFLSVFLLLWLAWLLLAGFDMAEAVVGGIACIIITAIIYRYLNFEFGLDFPMKLFRFIFIFTPVFIYELIKANLNMAYIVLSPKLPINPAFVKIPTKIKSPYGRLILANSITLTPGTLSLDADENYIYIHWINLKGQNNEEYQQNVSDSFERILGGIFNK